MLFFIYFLAIKLEERCCPRCCTLVRSERFPLRERPLSRSYFCRTIPCSVHGSYEAMKAITHLVSGFPLSSYVRRNLIQGWLKFTVNTTCCSMCFVFAFILLSRSKFALQKQVSFLLFFIFLYIKAFIDIAFQKWRKKLDTFYSERFSIIFFYTETKLFFELILKMLFEKVMHIKNFQIFRKYWQMMIKLSNDF